MMNQNQHSFHFFGSRKVRRCNNCLEIEGEHSEFCHTRETLLSDNAELLALLRTAEQERDRYKELMTHVIKECAESEALDDNTLNNIGQIGTGIRDMRCDLESLRAQLKAAQEQEPAVHIGNDGIPAYAINYDDPMTGVFYAAPVPAHNVEHDSADAVRSLLHPNQASAYTAALAYVRECEENTGHEPHPSMVGRAYDELVDVLTSAQQSINRQTIIDVLVASGNLSEGVAADLIISAIGAQESPAGAVPEPRKCCGNPVMDNGYVCCGDYLYGDDAIDQLTPVEYPSGQGVLIVANEDVNGVVIVRDESGEYRRVAKSAIKVK